MDGSWVYFYGVSLMWFLAFHVDVPSEEPTHAPEDNIPSVVKVAASRLATCWLLLTFTGMKNILYLLLSMKGMVLGIRRVTLDISILLTRADHIRYLNILVVTRT